MQDKAMGCARTGETEACAQWKVWTVTWNMVFLRDTSFCHDDPLCLIVYKSHNA